MATLNRKFALTYKRQTTNLNNIEKKNIRKNIYKTATWRALVKYKIRECPICEICNRNLSEDVHHLVSFVNIENIEERDKIAFDVYNLVSLCKKCHGKIHNDKNFYEKHFNLLIDKNYQKFKSAQ